MIAKITILLAVVAVAYGGVIAVGGSPPASTVKLIDAPVVLHAAHPVVHAAPIALAAPVPVAYAAAPVVVPAPVAYSTAAKVVHTYEPVEQHGYKIVY